MNPVEREKSKGNYRLAGQLQRLRGSDWQYGCHYGMRSERAWAIAEFESGWQEIEDALSGDQDA